MLLLLGSKILGTKGIRTSICNVLANHDQNIEFRFRLLKICLSVKLESSNCKIIELNLQVSIDRKLDSID